MTETKKTSVKEVPLTVETIKERIKFLQEQRDLTKANLVAFEGAIQDCNYWLNQLSGV